MMLLLLIGVGGVQPPRRGMIASGTRSARATSADRAASITSGVR